jgi:hypothetical protein
MPPRSIVLMLAIHPRGVSARRWLGVSRKFAALLNRFADLADVQMRSCAAATRFFRIARRKPIVQFNSATDEAREYFHLVMRIASQSSSRFP